MTITNVMRSLAATVITCLLLGCSDNNSDSLQLQSNVLVMTTRHIPAKLVQHIVDEDEAGDPNAPLAGDLPGDTTLVKLRGKTNHFGRDIQQSPPQYIDYHATVPGTRVWIAEHPSTRDLDIQTDDTGWWTMYVVKDRTGESIWSFHLSLKKTAGLPPRQMSTRSRMRTNSITRSSTSTLTILSSACFLSWKA